MKTKTKAASPRSIGEGIIRYATMIPRLGYRWLTVTEVAKYLDVQTSTVRRYYLFGSLDYLKLDNGVVRFTVAQVQAFQVEMRERALARLGIPLEQNIEELARPVPAHGLVKVTDVMRYFRLSRNPINRMATDGIIEIYESETGTLRCEIAQILAFEAQCVLRAKEGKQNGVLLGHHKVPTRNNKK